MSRHGWVWLLIALATAGCATNIRKEATVATSAGTNMDVDIGFGAERRSLWGVVAVLEYEGDDWTVVSMTDSRDIARRKDLREGPNQETLFVSVDLELIEPYYEDISQIRQATIECTPMFDQKGVYSPCKSRFMTVNAAMSAGKNLLSIFNSLGMNAGSHKALDHAEVVRAIEATDLLEAVAQKVDDIEYAEYVALFASAQSAMDYALFIDRYRRDDPDNLIPTAIERRNAALVAEENARLSGLPVDAQTQAIAIDNERGRIETFRESLDVGNTTNCGPIIEIEAGWVRVKHEVEGFGSRHWVLRSEVFPPRYPCEFVDGAYQPPSLR